MKSANICKSRRVRFIKIEFLLYKNKTQFHIMTATVAQKIVILSVVDQSNESVRIKRSYSFKDFSMAKVQKKGFIRIYNAGRYSMKGFRAGLENEAAIRQEMFLAVVLTAVSFYLRYFSDFGYSTVEMIALIAMPWITVVTELLNSGIEAVVDRIGTEYNELSGRAKDLGSAAVFVMLILTLVTWIALITDHCI